LAFKPNTDDIREAPALDLIDALMAAGATFIAFDPEAMPNVKKMIGDKIRYAESQYDALGCRCPDHCNRMERIQNTGF
jgi:UDPglucose 6-dehydrogenase